MMDEDIDVHIVVEDIDNTRGYETKCIHGGVEGHHLSIVAGAMVYEG